MKLAVLGAGAWGTAIANLLADNGHHVQLWCREAEVAQSIAQKHLNEHYLPGLLLHPSITTFTNIQETVNDTRWIFEAIPVKYMRSVLDQIKLYVKSEQGIVILSKGIEQNTLFFPTQIINDIFGVSKKQVVVAGPSFAHELIKKELTGVCIASSEQANAKEIKEVMVNNYFKASITQDIIGVQVGAALKNVIAIGMGIVDGAGCGDNAKAFLLTKGLQEMVIVAQALGGKQETLYDLAGIGDLVLTSMGTSSKNLALGKRLGQGESVEQILESFGTAPEGINTLQALEQIMSKKNLTLPICHEIYQIVFGQKHASCFLTAL